VAVLLEYLIVDILIQSFECISAIKRLGEGAPVGAPHLTIFPQDG